MIHHAHATHTVLKLLQHAAQYLGPGLLVEPDTFLGPLSDALAEDLRGWNGGVDEQTVCEGLARGLIREEHRQAPSARLHRRLAIKRQHAQLLEDVAVAGAHTAWLLAGDECDSYLNLQDLAGRAGRLLTILDELEMYAGTGNGTLRRHFVAGHLHFQCS